MLVLHPVGQGQAGYYQHEGAPGQWRGAGCGSLALPAVVDPASLRAVLAGREPDGELLLRRLPERRRSGFDLIFAAPKSVSLLGQLAAHADAPCFLAAHNRAVDAAIGYLERQATWTRRGAGHERIPTTGLIAAAFGHHWSGAGDPHLHTHVVVANLVRGADGAWSTLDSRALYRHRAAAGALFQASLKQALADQGLGFTWQHQRFGLADIAAVPRVAIDACSVRHRQVAAEIAAGSGGAGGRATAAGRTRRDEGGIGAERWEDRAARAGLDRAAASEMVAVARRRIIPPAVAPALAVTEGALAERRSQFERQDVVAVMAGLAAQGVSAGPLERWVDDYLTTAVSAGPAKWTTPGFQRLEQRIAALAASGAARTSSGLARPDVVEAVLAQRPALSPAGQDAVRRLTTGGAGVELVARGDFVGQAWVLDAARAAWETAGHRVAMLSPDDRGAARWRALSALAPPPPWPAQATVMLVDGADRRTTTELYRVLHDGGARNAKVVLIDGGTTSARRHAESPAFEELRRSVSGVTCGPAGRELSHLAATGAVVRAGCDRVVTMATDGPAAAAQLVADWYHARAETQDGAKRATMVALGPAEAEHLNAMARLRLQESGALAGPAVEAGGRHFQAGDEVRALRHDSRIGSVPAGTVGLVSGVDRDQMTIRWPTGDLKVTAAQLARAPLTHAYATTPPYVRGARSVPAMCLGDPAAVAPRMSPERIVHVTDTFPARPRLERPDPLRAVLADLPSIASAAPDDVSRSLAELSRERDHLADGLRASLPADPGPELRRIAEERRALSARQPQSEVGGRLAEMDRRQAGLTAAAAGRNAWIEDHGPQLIRWQELTAAIAWREHAFGQAAEIRPSRAVEAALGALPAEPNQRPAWREAAGAIEAYRERWGLPDQPLALSGPAPGPDIARRFDEQRVMVSCQAFEQSRCCDLGLSLPDG